MIFLQLLDQPLLLLVIALVLLHELLVALHESRTLDHVSQDASVIVYVATVDCVGTDGWLGQELIVDGRVELDCAVQLALQIGH